MCYYINVNNNLCVVYKTAYGPKLLSEHLNTLPITYVLVVHVTMFTKTCQKACS